LLASPKSLVQDNRDLIAVSVERAAELCGLSRSSIYIAIKAGKLTPRKAGARTLVLVSDLRTFIERLPRVGQ